MLNGVMENELRKNLLETASAFAQAVGCAVSTVSRRSTKDPNFFARLEDPTKSFTARTYDMVMRWFADNWPEGKVSVEKAVARFNNGERVNP